MLIYATYDGKFQVTVKVESRFSDTHGGFDLAKQTVETNREPRMRQEIREREAYT